MVSIHMPYLSSVSFRETSSLNMIMCYFWTRNGKLMIFKASLSDNISQVTSYRQDSVRTTNVENLFSKIFESYSCCIYIAQELYLLLMRVLDWISVLHSLKKTISIIYSIFVLQVFARIFFK